MSENLWFSGGVEMEHWLKIGQGRNMYCYSLKTFTITTS